MSRKTFTILSAVALIAFVASLAVVAQTTEARSGAFDPELLPPNAKPGECYARVWVPAKYSTGTEQVLKNEASEKIEIVPAKFEWTEETVMVKPATKKIDVVPARYETVTEKVLDQPAHTVWKKGSATGTASGSGAGAGSGAMAKTTTTSVDASGEATGEIMCLVEVPATYKTVTKRVLKTPATTREIEVPAQYKTVRVQKEAVPPQVKRISLPEQYQTVTKTSLVKEGHMAWMPVLCQTNATRSVVTSLQNSLKRSGLNPGPIDGNIGQQTLNAVEKYQRSKGLARGGITLETLKSLGVTFTR